MGIRGFDYFIYLFILITGIPLKTKWVVVNYQVRSTAHTRLRSLFTFSFSCPPLPYRHQVCFSRIRDKRMNEGRMDFRKAAKNYTKKKRRRIRRRMKRSRWYQLSVMICEASSKNLLFLATASHLNYKKGVGQNFFLSAKIK